MCKYTNRQDYINQCWQEIESAHNQVNRYYHNLEHLNNLYSHFTKIQHLLTEPDLFLFTLYYHDIIYNASRKDNEIKSADFFSKRIGRTNFPLIQETSNLIEQTKSHKKSVNADFNYFLDADLSILGSPTEHYQTYTQQVRKEYAIYPNFIYNKGRKKVIQHFLNMNSIYKTDYFIENFEEQARRNLRSELQKK